MSEERIRDLELFKVRTESGKERTDEILEKLSNTVDTLTMAVNNARGIVTGVMAIIGVCVVVLGYFLTDKVHQYDAVNDEQYRRINAIETAQSSTQVDIVKLQNDVNNIKGLRK